MAIKYSLGHSGEVIPLEIEDALLIDFTTIDGKEVMQEILAMKDLIETFQDYEEAIYFEESKFHLKITREPELDQLDLDKDSLEDF